MRRQHGFSLIEMVIVIVLLGVLATVSAALIRQPFDASAAVHRRARLADDADQAMARISRDVRRALPNSIRLSADGRAVELLRSVAAGRYRAGPTAAGAGDVLDFTASDSSFDVLGGLGEVPAAGQWAVVYNLTSSGAQANAWVGDNRASIAASSTADRLQLAAAFQFPYRSPQQRVYLVDSAVMFHCNDAGELRRESGYPPAAAMSVPPGSGDSELLTDTASSCSFRYDPGASSRHALVGISLGLTRDGETVTLQKSVHVPNTP